MSEHKLDNPVWYSLSETHQPLAVDHGSIKFYHPDYCPFGGFDQQNRVALGIREYALLTDNFFVVGHKPDLPDNVAIGKELVCLQMVMRKKPDLVANLEIIKLDETYRAALFDLVNLVQPGYFKSKTGLMGDYFGVFEKQKLVAVAGERMKMHDFTEVSAVVTHPAHTGKGYASQLVTYVGEHVRGQGKIPYLHVVESNTSAIRIYEKLGFETRRRISFWNVVSVDNQNKE